LVAVHTHPVGFTGLHTFGYRLRVSVPAGYGWFTVGCHGWVRYVYYGYAFTTHTVLRSHTLHVWLVAGSPTHLHTPPLHYGTHTPPHTVDGLPHLALHTLGSHRLPAAHTPHGLRTRFWLRPPTARFLVATRLVRTPDCTCLVHAIGWFALPRTPTVLAAHTAFTARTHTAWFTRLHTRYTRFTPLPGFPHHTQLHTALDWVLHTVVTRFTAGSARFRYGSATHGLHTRAVTARVTHALPYTHAITVRGYARFTVLQLLPLLLGLGLVWLNLPATR